MPCAVAALICCAKEDAPMATQFHSRSREPSEMAVRAEALLSRYPDLSEPELASLIHTFPYLPILDVGLMTADDRLSEKLEAFHRNHGHKLRAPASSLDRKSVVSGKSVSVRVDLVGRRIIKTKTKIIQ